MKELIKSLNEKDILWFFMATLISADNLREEKDYEDTLIVLNEIKECLDDVKQDLNNESFEKLCGYVDDAFDIINRELCELKLNQNENRKTYKDCSPRI